MADDIPDTGYEMFTKRNGEPIKFSIPICPEKEDLRKLIEAYGGTVTSMAGGHHTIRLIPPNLKVPAAKGYDTFSTRFIEDSVSSKRILDLNSYRIGKSQFNNKVNVNDILLGSKSWADCEDVADDSGEEVSDFDDDGGPPQRQQRGFKPNRRDYSYKEKKAILQYIVNNRRYSEVKGRALWQEMEARKVCAGRTWGSMKEHFRKAIMNNLHLFKLTDEEKRRLSSPYALYVDSNKISSVRDEDSSSESDVDIDMSKKQRRQKTKFNEEDRNGVSRTPRKFAELRQSDSDFDNLVQTKEYDKQKYCDNKVTTEQEKNKTVAAENRLTSKIPADEIQNDMLGPIEKKSCDVTCEMAGPRIITGSDTAGPSKVSSTEAAGPSKITVPEAEESSDESNDCLAREQLDSMSSRLRLPDIVCSAPLPPEQNTQSFDPVLTSQEFPTQPVESLFFDMKVVSTTTLDVASSKHCRSPTCNKESVKEQEKSEQSPTKACKYTSQTGNNPDLDVGETNAPRDIDDMHSQMFANIALPESSDNPPSSRNIDDKTSERSQDPSDNKTTDSVTNTAVEGELPKNVASESANQLVRRLAREWNQDSDSSSSSGSGSSTIIFELTHCDKKGGESPNQLVKNNSNKSCHQCDGDGTCISETDENALTSLPKDASEVENHRKGNTQMKSRNTQDVCNKSLNRAVQQRQEENDSNSDLSSSESEDVPFEMDSDEEPIKLRRDTRMCFSKQLRFRAELQRGVSAGTKEQDEKRIKSQFQANPTSKVMKYVDDSPSASGESESEIESVASNYGPNQSSSDPNWNRDNFTGRYDRGYHPHGVCEVGIKHKIHGGYKKKQNLPYTKDEDIAILEYIIEQRAYGRLGGREFWQGMERNLLPKRTWQSLKERFRMRIANRLPLYVEHGISEGRLRRLERAIKLPKEDSKVKEEDSEVHRKQYSRGEDQAIIHFIIKNKRHAEVGGKMMWVLMSRNVRALRGRTWLSLKERFRRRIVNHLEDFDISLDDKKRLLMNGNHGRNGQKRYFDPCSHEESSSESSESDSEEERGQSCGKITAKKSSEEYITKCRDASLSDKERNKRSRQIMEKHFSDNSKASSSRCVASGPSDKLLEGKADNINTELPEKKRKRKLYSKNEGVVLTLPQSEELEIANRESEDSLPEKHSKDSLETDRHNNQDPRHEKCSTDLRSTLIDQNCDAFSAIDSTDILNNDKDEPGHVPNNTKRDIPSDVALGNCDSIQTNSLHAETAQNITPNSPPAADAGSGKQESTCKYSLKTFFQKAATPPATRYRTSKSSDSGRDSRNTRRSGVTPRRKLRKKAVRCFRC